MTIKDNKTGFPCITTIWPRGWVVIQGKALIRGWALIRGNTVILKVKIASLGVLWRQFFRCILLFS